MKIKRRFGSGLTVREAGELFAIPKEKLDLEARHVVRHQLAPVQFHIGRGQDNGARLVGSFPDRKSTRLNSSHVEISYAVFCLKKKKNTERHRDITLQHETTKRD